MIYLFTNTYMNSLLHNLVLFGDYYKNLITDKHMSAKSLLCLLFQGISFSVDGSHCRSVSISQRMRRMCFPGKRLMLISLTFYHLVA